MICRDLHGLYLPVRRKVLEFLQYANTHIHFPGMIEPFETIRTKERQIELKGTGYSKTTLSWHQLGLAIDLWPSTGTGGWPNAIELDKWEHWKELGAMGQAFGFEWGGCGIGAWKGFSDRPHFQMTFGAPKQQLFDIYNKRGITYVWAYLDSIKK